MKNLSYYTGMALIIAGIAVIALEQGRQDEEILGAAYTEVPRFTKTCGSPTWEHTVRRISDGQIFVFQVTQAEYDAWMQKNMTEQGTLPPQYDGYEYVSSTGGKENCTTATTTLSSWQYYAVKETTGTTTGLYVYKEGNKQPQSTTTRP
jgi:hypothetical protein